MIDQGKLSATSARALAAHNFRLRHPDFYPVKANWDLIDAYLDRHKLPRSDSGYDQAYRAVYSQILTKDEAIALMTPEEIRQFAQNYGREVFDATTGKSMGWDFPDSAPAPEPAVLTQRNSLGQTITARTAAPLKERTRQPSVTRALGDFIRK